MAYHSLPERYPGMYERASDGRWVARKSKRPKAGVCNVRCCRRPSQKSQGSSGNLSCVTCRLRLWRANNPIRASYNAIKNKASRRGIPFRLSFEYFRDLCLRTDYHRTRGRLPDDFHLDRVDATRGYSDDNVQVITATENTQKRHIEECYAHYAEP